MSRWRVLAVVACLGMPRLALAVEPDAPVARAPERPIAAGVRVFRSDLGQFLSRRTLVVLASGGALAGIAATHEDPQGLVHDLSGSAWEDASNVGNAWGDGALALGLTGAMLLAGHVEGDSTMFETGFQLARGLVYTGVLVEGLKVMANRTRPDGGKYSFPSGHAAIASSMVPILARAYGFKVGVPAGVLAGLTSIGRLEDRRHYLSDVIFGSALGLSVGLAVSDPGPAHAITFGLVDRGAALTLKF